MHKMDMSEEKVKRIDEIEKHVIAIIVKYINPKKIILFGSRVKNKNTNSDFDFAVDAIKPSITIQRKISEDIEKVIGLYKTDIVYLNSVEEAFKQIIIKTGKVIYERKS